MEPGELQRYARHLLLPEVGLRGQELIRSASVLCIGAGGLGSPVAMYLAAAGIGRLGIVDSDTVEVSNLQRQLLHGTGDVGRLKTDSAQESLQAINPGVRLDLHPVRLTSQNARALLTAYDLIVDCTDNLPTRYLVNDACVMLGKPAVYGAIFRFEGQASVFAPHLGGPCYRCLYPEMPPPEAAPSCAEAGVLGVLPGIIGCIQAMETLKLILRQGQPLIGRLLALDALSMSFRELRVLRDPGCPVCGENPTITQLADLPEPCLACPPAPTGSLGELSVIELKAALDRQGGSFVLLDVREPAEHQIARIPGSVLIPLQQLPSQAESLDPAVTYYVHCKSGIRSARAVEFLKSKGFKHVRNVRGGILAWSKEIDPSVPLY